MAEELNEKQRKTVDFIKEDTIKKLKNGKVSDYDFAWRAFVSDKVRKYLGDTQKASKIDEEEKDAWIEKLKDERKDNSRIK